VPNATVVNCTSSTSESVVENCIGYITRYIITKVQGNIYTVSEIIVKSTAGFHQFSVSLKTGIKLYEYINSSGRSQRMDNVRFYFIVISYKQCVIDYTAHDAGEWIGDIIERERKEA
jgi:hypothetical protein